MFLSEIAVSLLVRLWVEIAIICKILVASASQPPCEAVSWNVHIKLQSDLSRCQPPCEAVSWNDLEGVIFNAKGVSLLVRLWVEMPERAPSAPLKKVSLLVRLWVEILWIFLVPVPASVSLLVRLWVEMSQLHYDNPFVESASLWGCELK